LERDFNTLVVHALRTSDALHRSWRAACYKHLKINVIIFLMASLPMFGEYMQIQQRAKKTVLLKCEVCGKDLKKPYETDKPLPLAEQLEKDEELLHYIETAGMTAEEVKKNPALIPTALKKGGHSSFVRLDVRTEYASPEDEKLAKEIEEKYRLVSTLLF
jgi:hypothetical protein